MKKINIKELAFLTLVVLCLFYWGIFLENIFEPFAGALIFSVIYLLLLCGRAPKSVRAFACFIMSWGLFFFARKINADMCEFNAPLLEYGDEISIIEAKFVFGYQTQAVISVVIAVVAYFLGKSKFVTIDR